MNPTGAGKLRVSSKGLAAGKLALHEGQGFLRRADAAIARDFNPLMLLKGEQKLSRGVVVLIASGKPNARSNFGLFESENTPAIELAEDAAAERDVANYVGLGTDNLFRAEKAKIRLRFSVINLTNKEALYNFLSSFSGTHFVTPRAYQVQLGVTF